MSTIKMGFVSPPDSFNFGSNYATDAAAFQAVRKLASADNINTTLWFAGCSYGALQATGDPYYPSLEIGSPVDPADFGVPRFRNWADILVRNGWTIILQLGISPVPNGSSSLANWQAASGSSSAWDQVNFLDTYATRIPNLLNTWKYLFQNQLYCVLDMANYISSTYGVDPKNYIQLMLPNEPRAASTSSSAVSTTTTAGSSGNTLNLSSTTGCTATVGVDGNYITVQNGSNWATYQITQVNAGVSVNITPALTHSTGAGVTVLSCIYQLTASGDTYPWDTTLSELFNEAASQVQTILPGYQLWSPPLGLIYGTYEEYISNIATQATLTSDSWLGAITGWAFDYYYGSASDAPDPRFLTGWPGPRELARQQMLAVTNIVQAFRSQSAFGMNTLPILNKEFGPTPGYGTGDGMRPFRTAHYGRCVFEMFKAYQRRTDLYGAMFYKPLSSLTAGTPTWDRDEYGPIQTNGSADASVREMIRGSNVDCGVAVPPGFENTYANLVGIDATGNNWNLASGEQPVES